jgi:hypothetical protein
MLVQNSVSATNWQVNKKKSRPSVKPAEQAELNKIMIVNMKNSIRCRISIWAAAVAALAIVVAATSGSAQPAGDTWQNLQEIVKFTQAHMSDEVIVNSIKTSGKIYPTSADALLYLNSQGVSQPVLAALLAGAPSAGPAPAPEPPPAAVMTAPPETPTIDYFQAHLTPYGQWIDVPDIGPAWVPAEANNPAWRPYMDAGHWQFTDAGWFWQSDYPWGDMAFHYGRWVNNGLTGGRWAWAPGYNWAPSWVSWREGAGGMGWAPLPWGVEFRVGLGLYWHGAAVVEGVDFGLGFQSFVFVGNDHFWGGNYNLYVFDRERSQVFYQHSTFHAGYRMEGGHLMAEGLGRDHMAQITHHEVVVQKVSELRRAEETHNFAKRTAEHKELTRAPVHGKETGHPEANHSPEARERTTSANNERGASTHLPDARATAPGAASNIHPGAANEHGTTTHLPDAHSTAPGAASSNHPGAASEHGTTTHPPDARSTATANPGNTHPGAPGLNSKEPTPNSKLPATKPKPGTTSTNQAPSVPK